MQRPDKTLRVRFARPLFARLGPRIAALVLVLAALSVIPAPAAADDVFTTVVSRLASALGVSLRPGRDFGCRRAGECRAAFGAITLRSAGTTLTLSQALQDPPSVARACAIALAAVSDLDAPAAHHVVDVAAAHPVSVDGISVTRSTTPAGLVCRLQIPPR